MKDMVFVSYVSIVDHDQPAHLSDQDLHRRLLDSHGYFRPEKKQTV
jgi:hypothetical protein